MTSMREQIETKLSSLDPMHLEVFDESQNHNVPAGSESHFKVVIVSDIFDGEKLIARHRRINEMLKKELACSIHALALHTYTEQDWYKRFGEAPMSPPCHGGSAKTDV